MLLFFFIFSTGDLKLGVVPHQEDILQLVRLCSHIYTLFTRLLLHIHFIRFENNFIILDFIEIK